MKTLNNSSFDSGLKSMNKGLFAMGKVTTGLVIIGFLFVVCALCCSLMMSVSGQYQSHATEQAQQWATGMYPGETAHISCQNADTDNNGYVSCTVRIGERSPMGIECSNPMSMNNGCRIPPLQNMLQRQSQ